MRHDLPDPSSAVSARRGHPRRPAAVLALAMTGTLGLTALTPAAAAVVDEPVTFTADGAAFELTPLGSHESGVFDESAAEIAAHHPRSQRLFTVNAHAGQLDVIDVRDPGSPRKVGALVAAGTVDAQGQVIPDGAVANSVAIRPDGLGVVAVEAPTKTDDGWLVVFDAGGRTAAPLGAVRVGAQPDMVALTDDGRSAVVANEGEPSEDFTVDPEGSVSVIGLPRKVGVPLQDDVRTADFRAFDARAPCPTACASSARPWMPSAGSRRTSSPSTSRRRAGPRT